MADYERLFELILGLPLQELDEDWIKNVWESQFTEVDITDDLSKDVSTADLSQLRTELTHWSAQGDNEVLWVHLSKNNVSIESILAYIGHLIVTGNKASANVDKQLVGCVTAQVYTKLLLTSGSSAFKVFHPELYEKSIDYLKLYFTLGADSGRKRKSKSPFKSSQPKKKGKKRKKQDASYDEDEEENPFPANDDNDSDDVIEKSPQEMRKIQNALQALLVDVVTLLESYSLKQNVMSMRHTVQILSNLVRLDIEAFDGNFSSRVPFRIKCTPALAYKGLTFLCSQLHGQTGAMINATCKGLLPCLLMLVDGKPVQTIYKQIQLVQEHAVNFICYLLQEGEDRVVSCVRTLLQHMCTKVTDRAEYRTKVAATVVKITQQLPDEGYCKMVQWFYILSKSHEINNRGFMIEVVSTLLKSPERRVTSEIAPDLVPYLSHRSHLGILIDRCSDTAPTVRAKAIACFGVCLGSSDEVVASTVLEIMTPVGTERQGQRPRLIRTPAPHNVADTVVGEDSTIRPEVTITQEGSTIATERTSDLPAKDSPLHRVALTPGFDPNLTDSEGLFSMLRRRAKDDKLIVRKAAIQAVENAIMFEAPVLTEQNLEVLSEHCRDPSLSVRKQTMQSLTDLLIGMTTNKTVQKHWLLGVLPLVLDRESTLSDKCLEIMEDLILNQIVLKIRSTSEEHILAWDLLNIIAQPPNMNKRQYLCKACQFWSRQGKIKSALISALETHIGTDNNKAAWMFLAQIAPAAPKIGHTLLMNYWKEPDEDVEIMGQALIVTRHFLQYLPSEDMQWLRNLLKSRLLEFSSPPELLSATVNTLAKIYDLQKPQDRRKSKHSTDWCQELLTGSDLYLSKVILQNTSSVYNEDLVICHLFTLGEVVQYCPASVSKRIILLVQSMIATPCIASLPASQSQPSSQNDNSKSSEVSSTEYNRTHEDISGSSNDSGGSQELQASQGTQFTQTSQSSQQLTQFRGSIMSQRVRAFAFIALGKLCLQHDNLTKKCLPALAREMEISTDPTIRNNVMIVICDLCVRYPTTANNYSSKISSVLKDGSPLLRKQAVILIARLIQEDFLKWKGALFYQFISTLLDECEEIKELSKFFLIHKMLPRFPNILFQHFIECIFHFNNYTTHRVYNQFQQTEKDRENFSLKGDKLMKKREELYKFLLENMVDEHRFEIQSKICKEILVTIVDGIMPFDDSTHDLLRDSLKILSCKEIKLKILKSEVNEEITGNEQEIANIVVAVARKTFMTQVVKKNLMEKVIPTLAALKKMMDKKRSPLLKHVMVYLQELMKDYKKEVKEFFEMDKQLAAEIEYDLRKFDEEQARNQNKGSPAVSSSPVAVQGGSSAGSPRAASSAGSPRSPVLRGTAGSPARQLSSPARQLGIPARQPESPARHPGSPARLAPQGSPVLQLKWPVAGTPYRVAMMNSARKRMEGGKDQPTGTQQVPDNVTTMGTGSPELSINAQSGSQQMAGSKQMPVKVNGDKVAGSPKLSESGSQQMPGSSGLSSISNDGQQQICGSLPLSEDGEGNSSSGTPETSRRTRRKVYRAISTPAVDMENITFQGDGNMTFLPPSPIPERMSVARIYDETEHDKENEESVLATNSPNINEKPSKDDQVVKSPVVVNVEEESPLQEARPTRKRRKNKSRR